jgi:hypothetical protein
VFEGGDLQVIVGNHSLVVSPGSLERSKFSSGGVELSGQVSDGDVEVIVIISKCSNLLGHESDLIVRGVKSSF